MTRPPPGGGGGGRRVLIARAARDYQVTVADDLSRWQAALGGRPDVTIEVFAADDHLFFPGSGPSTPAGYEPAQHVDPEVVRTIAAWLTRTAGHNGEKGGGRGTARRGADVAGRQPNRPGQE